MSLISPLPKVPVQTFAGEIIKDTPASFIQAPPIVAARGSLSVIKRKLI